MIRRYLFDHVSCHGIICSKRDALLIIHIHAVCTPRTKQLESMSLTDECNVLLETKYLEEELESVAVYVVCFALIF